ncbi:hypothetical protein HDU86_004339 [Geranomyces michiganensis]|nr:hypothetical protein HDU86_004339 [Geranomyces michiganensis]
MSLRWSRPVDLMQSVGGLMTTTPDRMTATARYLRIAVTMPAAAVATARARVFARDFTSLDVLRMPVVTYRHHKGELEVEKVQAIDFGPYRISNTLSILHLTSEFGFLTDLQACVSAQQLASTDYQTDYDDLSAGRFWETLDTDLELLSNSMKVLI